MTAPTQHLPDRLLEGYDRLRATRDAPFARDIALLVARGVLAWVFIYHGAGTLFGAFGNGGLHADARFFSTYAGLHPATFFACVDGTIQFVGSIAVLLGIFGRLGALAIVGDMCMAMATVTFSNGVSSTLPGGGYELNLALAGLALVVALLGTGRYSLDRAAGRWLATRTGRTKTATSRVAASPSAAQYAPSKRSDAMGDRARRTT
jgi:putative oxidoreductase